MPRSSAGQGSLAGHEFGVLWGAWVELGVSGWQQTHGDWVIDPEPLIVRTAALGDAEPRLRDEALDWCIQNWRHVSATRLRNLLRRQSEATRDTWGPFAATVNEHTTARWPGETKPVRYRPTGRSLLGSLDQPSRAWLRLRFMFGVGARAEILRYFLSSQRRATVAAIAAEIGYAKRNVADACDALAKAGILKVRQVGNRFYYSLDRATELRNLVGAIAPIRPRWTSLLEVTSAFVALEAAAKAAPDEVLMVEAHRVTRSLDQPLDQLGIDERPALVQRNRYWVEVRDFAERYMADWSAGRWVAGEQVGNASA